VSGYFLKRPTTLGIFKLPRRKVPSGGLNWSELLNTLTIRCILCYYCSDTASKAIMLFLKRLWGLWDCADTFTRITYLQEANQNILNLTIIT